MLESDCPFMCVVQFLRFGNFDESNKTTEKRKEKEFHLKTYCTVMDGISIMILFSLLCISGTEVHIKILNLCDLFEMNSSLMFS